jgi:anti-sigma regulatory factor (Ser/Thr protein kinase)
MRLSLACPALGRKNMSDPKTVDFLSPGVAQIRHQLRGILESYSHDWDVLAELAQNAVDAIAREKPTKGHIRVTVDALKKTVSFADNGTGIDPDQLPRLLGPFATDKYGEASQIGQKGVGLTFVIFSSDNFEVQTSGSAGAARGMIKSARSWLNSDDSERISATIAEISASATSGTEVTVRLSDDNHPIWSLSFDQLLYVLRTRTALGSTNYIWGSPLSCDFTIAHTDQSGNHNAQEIECNYLLPTEGLPDHEVIALNDYKEWLADSDKDRSDSDKRAKLKGKILVHQGSDYRGGRDLKYWCCFVPKRDVWRTLSSRHGLIKIEDEDVEAFVIDEAELRLQFGSGLLTSSKGMPTGILVDLRPRGSGGYLPNFMILIEDPSLSFDIGRKSIQGRQQAMLRELAFERFREFLKIVAKYISGSPGAGGDGYDREELLEEIRLLPDLTSEKTAFLKRPNNQEATVAAIFYEQMGKGEFGAFAPLITGYKDKYDLYARISKKLFVVEFKFNLAQLFRDFGDERKMFDDIDMAVIWDITEADRKVVSALSLELEEIKSSSFGDEEPRFPLAQYRLRMSNVRPVEIFCLRNFLE